MFLPLVFSGVLVGSLRAVVGGVGLLSLFCTVPSSVPGWMCETIPPGTALWDPTNNPEKTRGRNIVPLQ